jgi:hypothetical protein
MEICIGQLLGPRNPGKQASDNSLENHLKVCQELEAPAITALREMRKWTHNPSTAHRSGMELAILVNTMFFMSIGLSWSLTLVSALWPGS